jgi:hypothetical protein
VSDRIFSFGDGKVGVASIDGWPFFENQRNLERLGKNKITVTGGPANGRNHLTASVFVRFRAFRRILYQECFCSSTGVQMYLLYVIREV